MPLAMATVREESRSDGAQKTEALTLRVPLRWDPEHPQPQVPPSRAGGSPPGLPPWEGWCCGDWN